MMLSIVKKKENDFKSLDGKSKISSLMWAILIFRDIKYLIMISGGRKVQGPSQKDTKLRGIYGIPSIPKESSMYFSSFKGRWGVGPPQENLKKLSHFKSYFHEKIDPILKMRDMSCTNLLLAKSLTFLERSRIGFWRQGNKPLP